MKRGKQINIKINFSNSWLYTFIIFGILIVAGIGVYAYNTGSPTTSGHTWNEIAGIPTGFADGVDNEGSVPSNGWYGYGIDTDSGCLYAREPVYGSGNDCLCRSGYTRLVYYLHLGSSYNDAITCLKN